jgi:hypothetical protein
MTTEELNSLTDAQLAQYFRDASLERAKCGFNWVSGNRIVDSRMTPAHKVLKSRGRKAMQGLLQLTDDPSPSVRADAAVYAYDVDPIRCRDVLKELVGEPGLPGAIAVVWLIDKDTEFRAEFAEMGRFGSDGFLREMDRRYPPKRER